MQRGAMASEKADNFVRDQKGRRKSQRRSSILKISRAFDEIQNTSHDDRFIKDRRVSFANSVEIKEFLKESTAVDTARKISTPKSNQPKDSQDRRLAAFDRLSIIPKFEKSFVETNSEDFEPYDDDGDEDPVKVLEDIVEKSDSLSNPKTIELHSKEIVDLELKPPPSPPAVGIAVDPKVVTCSSDPPQETTPTLVQDPDSSCHTCDMELTGCTPDVFCPSQNFQLCSPRAFLVVPEITAMGNECPTDGDSGVGSVENDVHSKKGSPGAVDGKYVTVNDAVSMSFTMLEDQSAGNDTLNRHAGNTCEDMEIDVESFSVEEKKGNGLKMTVDAVDMTGCGKDRKENGTITTFDAVKTVASDRGRRNMATCQEKVVEEAEVTVLTVPKSLPNDDASTLNGGNRNDKVPIVLNSTSKEKYPSKPPLPTVIPPEVLGTAQRKSVAAEKFSVIQTSLKKKRKSPPMPVHVPRSVGTWGVPAVAVSTPLNHRASYVSRHTPTFSVQGKSAKHVSNKLMVSSLGLHDDYQQCDMEMAHSCLGEQTIHSGPMSAPSPPPPGHCLEAAGLKEAVGFVSSLTSHDAGRSNHQKCDVVPVVDPRNTRLLSRKNDGVEASEKESSLRSSDLETVSSWSDLGRYSTASPPTTSTEGDTTASNSVPSVNDRVATGNSLSSGQNWFETRDSSFNLIESSGDTEGLSEVTVEKKTTSQSCPAPPYKRRKTPFRRKKRRTPRASLIQNLKARARGASNVTDIETPEMIQLECREEAVPAEQISLFNTPELTDDITLHHHRQSLMMSPSGFTKFLTNLNCDKTLGDQTLNQELVSCLGGECMEVSAAREGTDKSTTLKGDNPVVSNEATYKSSIKLGIPGSLKSEASALRGDSSDPSPCVCPSQMEDPLLPPETSFFHSNAQPLLPSPLPPSPLPPSPLPPSPLPPSPLPPSIDTLSHSHHHPPPPPLEMDSNFLPPDSRSGSSSPAHTSVTNCPQLPETAPNFPSLEILSSSSPPSQPHLEPTVQDSVTPPPPLPQPPEITSTDKKLNLSSRHAEELEDSIRILTRDVSDGTFITHIHLLRARFLLISRSSQARLNNSDYMNRDSHSLFRPFLESIITRANIGISVLTLLINYGDISGLAKPRERILPVKDIPISETLRRDKFEWMKSMHNDIGQKWCDIEAAMVSAAEIYHWQVDCWNRSKIGITIHNSAKITFTLEEGPVCMYPQGIAKTRVQYVRGSLLFSKPQTKACTTTADIVQLLWTIIRHGGNS